MYGGFEVKYPSFVWDSNQTWIFWTEFRKILITVSWKSVSGSRDVPCRQTDGRTRRSQ